MRERTRNGAAIVIATLGVLLAVQALLAPQIAFTGITLRRDDHVLVVATVDPASRVYGHIEPGAIVENVDYASWMVVPSAWFDRYLQGDFVELGVVDASGNEHTSYTFPATGDTPLGLVLLVGVGLLLGILAWVRRGQAGESLRPVALPLAVAERLCR